MSPEYSLLESAEFHGNVLRTHQLYMKPEHHAILSEIFAREPFEYEYELWPGRSARDRGLLTFADCDALLQAHIAFEHLNEKFSYMDTKMG